MVRTRAWRNGVLEAEDFDPAHCSEYLAEDGLVVWLDLENPDAADLDLLAEEFGLHPVTIDGATVPHQRPSIQRYHHHLFMVTYASWLTPAGRLETSEGDAFVGGRYLITVRK